MSNKSIKIFLISTAGIIFLGVGCFWVYTIIQHKKITELDKSQSDIRQIFKAYDSGETDDAIILAQKKLDQDPEDIQSLINLADTYLNKGSLDHQEKTYAPMALQIAEKIISKDPSNASAYRIKGYAFEITEKYDEAIISYNKALELAPFSSKIYNSRGHAYDLMGQYDSAKADYLKAYEINPNDINVMMNLARMYQYTGDDTKAGDFAKKIIDQGENSPAYIKANAYHILGQIYLSEEKYNEAIDNFSNSVNVLPSFVLGYVGRAQTLILKYATLDDNEKDQIVKDLSKATELDPSFTWSYFFFGEFYLLEKDKIKALEYYQKALENVDLDLSIGVLGKEPMKIFFQNTINKVNSKI